MSSISNYFTYTSIPVVIWKKTLDVSGLEPHVLLHVPLQDIPKRSHHSLERLSVKRQALQIADDAHGGLSRLGREESNFSKVGTVRQPRDLALGTAAVGLSADGSTLLDNVKCIPRVTLFADDRPIGKGFLLEGISNCEDFVFGELSENGDLLQEALVNISFANGSFHEDDFEAYAVEGPKADVRGSLASRGSGGVVHNSQFCVCVFEFVLCIVFLCVLCVCVRVCVCVSFPMSCHLCRNLYSIDHRPKLY